jgi:hypothetical protein
MKDKRFYEYREYYFYRGQWIIKTEHYSLRKYTVVPEFG